MGLWQFFFKYPPVVFEKGRLMLGAPLSAWMLALAVALLALAAWSYRRAGGGAASRERAVLVVLRGAILVVLLLILCRPVLEVPVAVPRENYVGVLIDNSRSMRIADGDAGPRGEQVRQGVDAEFLDALSKRFRVRLFGFSGSTSGVDSVTQLDFLGGQTRLGAALDQARAELSGLPLAGLLVITDGGDQAETALNASLLGLRSASVPVYTVGVGRESFDRDIEVRRVSAPASTLVGTSLVLDVLVAQTGYAGETVQLVVEDEGRIVDTEPVVLPRDGTPAAVRVHFTASTPGWRRFSFRVSPREGELVTENNERDALIHVREERQKILYVEGEPRFEVGFMRRAIQNDPQLQLVVLQRTAENKFQRFGVDSAAELATGFPTTREELFKYRALVLGSVDAGFFSREQLQLISDFVSERGGGLLMLGGRHSFSEGGYAATAVAGALPVRLDADPDTTFFTKLKVEPTRAGLAAAMLRLDPDSSKSAERWKTLPDLSTFNRVTRAKPGATTLLTGSGPGVPEGQIVLAYERYGRGLSVALPVRDTWIWQMDASIPLDDQTHETFWRQMLRWLVNDVPDQISLSLSEEPAAVDQTETVTVQLRDSAYRGMNDASVTARIIAPGPDTLDLPLRWTADRDGEYAASFVPDSEGLYEISVNAVRGGKTVASTLREVRAVVDDGEFFSAQMRAPLLRRIADETGGRFYTMSTLSRVPEEIRYSGQGVTTLEQYDLWDMPIVFFLLIGLIGAEWGYRRKQGLA